jgi:hypothetical protein
MDCSGFAWHVLSYVAEKGGVNLGARLRRAMRIGRSADPSFYAGTAFYNSKTSQIQSVDDRIENLRPADIMLFRGYDGEMAHSAVIQSIDFTKGVIRYLQCTDEAPLIERGVHESFIHFDPKHPEISLSDPSLSWPQKRYPPFPGEKASPFSDDGKRFRAYPELGGGRVVRLKAVTQAIELLPK